MAKVMDKTEANDQAAPEVLHFTAAERAARGKAARAEVPRTSHAGFELVADRDPVQILMDQAPSRVPELVPIRYGRMLVSPFTFYRGAAAIMAADLAPTPRVGLQAQLCGDAHLANFGGFASPERDLVFDLNDFDETLPGPVRVGREAARRELRDRGPRPQLRRRWTARRSCSAWYASTASAMRRLRGDAEHRRCGTRGSTSRPSTKSIREQGAAKQAANVEAAVAKARTKDSMRAFTKLTERGRRRAAGSSATRR